MEESRLRGRVRSRQSMTQSEVFDQFPVAVHVFALQVLEEPPPAPHHPEEAAAAVMVVPVGIEVAPEVVDPRGKKGDLDLGAPTAVLVGLIFPYDLLSVDTHCRFRASTVSAPEPERRGRGSSRLPGGKLAAEP